MYKESASELKARSTVHKLIITMKKHRGLFDEMRERTGLGRSAHRMLMIVSDSDGTLSQTFLAEKLEISTAAVAVMLKKMESDGYISRKANAADSRFNTIELTQKGAEVVESSKKAFFAIDSALFEGFAENEMDNLNEFLDRLQTNIAKLEGGKRS
ncbi:MAG: MarR family transcriptional regulator [Clostridia bacterium]|nr:MarR family transcriptional regulator [Clostridia bacterium]